MLYALIIAFGSHDDIHFQDVVTYPSMEECEKDRPKQVEYIKSIHPWITIAKGVCTPEHQK